MAEHEMTLDEMWERTRRLERAVLTGFALLTGAATETAVEADMPEALESLQQQFAEDLQGIQDDMNKETV